MAFEAMDSGTIRRKFLDFFRSKAHQVVPSAPLVLKNDPSLLFTNSGMVQFKDYFLGNAVPKSKRIADTQKCLRVSGKHNDLEDVGLDTYHHTMFEMLGNWSFGDYFKKEAIAWAWELLTDVYKLPKERLYVTVFGGDKTDNLPLDDEAMTLWKSHIPDERILHGSKKDNFWEMGESGPCGPCSEIHIDLRPDSEVKKSPGKDWVNKDHPQVVEIWNLVFIQFNRLASGKLEPLPQKHVDTGMGFERLCMAIQGKTSNYDTDVFTPLIKFISLNTGVKYENTDYVVTSGQQSSKGSDIAMRVIADHVRAVAFAIADGQLPSNSGSGYVIRRILRRAIRYGYSFLDRDAPFIHRLVPLLALQLKDVFPELHQQQNFVERVIEEEEAAFLRTLRDGMDMLSDYFRCHNEVVKNLEFVDNNDFEAVIRILQESDQSHHSPEGIFQTEQLVNRISKLVNERNLDAAGKEVRILENQVLGASAFILNDTFGFPYDLTSLIARERGFTVDEAGFTEEMQKQKSRSKVDASKETGDWVSTGKNGKTEFIGYDMLESSSRILRYRKVKAKNRELYQIVFDKTPFYAESGGQVGDTGVIEGKTKVSILDTKKENDLIVHITEALPDPADSLVIKVDAEKRGRTMNNHSATHLLHATLRTVLGKHVEQKGSLVNEKILRFDFSHFASMTDAELAKVESLVNEKIRANIPLDEKRNVPIAQAKEMGAMALFGEKYGDFVRVITFDPRFSVELCGGTHVPATGSIGYLKVISESSVAAGVRRIEAVTGEGAQEYFNQSLAVLGELKSLLKNPKDPAASLQSLIEEKHGLEKKIEAFNQERATAIKDELVRKAVKSNGHTLILERIAIGDVESLKSIAYALRNQFDDLLLVLAADVDNKPQVAVMIGEKLAATNKFHAGNMVKELAREIDGGGGGQPFFATAGGKNLGGLGAVLDKARKLIG